MTAAQYEGAQIDGDNLKFISAINSTGVNELEMCIRDRVIDAGTCITYEFIDSKGQYHGGNISAGMQMRFKALKQFTGRLLLIDSNGRKLPIGRDTETAIRAGVLKGLNRILNYNNGRI